MDWCSKAIEQYDAALAVAVAMGDKTKEGMICMGKGFALLNSGEAGGTTRAARADSACQPPGATTLLLRGC